MAFSGPQPKNVSAMFVLFQNHDSEPYWQYSSMSNDINDIARFVRSVEKDIIITRNKPFKTLMYKIVPLEI